MTETMAPRAELTAAKRALLEARLRGQGRAAGLARREHGAEVPLSFAQERLWFLHRLQPGGASYNVPAALRLPAGVDAAALERALGEVIRRHDALRTTFREADGVPVQVIHPFVSFHLPVEELSGLADAEREAALRTRAVEHARRPFDLGTGPLFRAALLRTGAAEQVLLLCMHHIVSDGWSMRVLFRELWALYAAFREGRSSPLAELPIQYPDYAAWQREPAQRQAEARHLAYWARQMAGAPELLELPTDRPRPPVPSLRGDAVPVDADADVLARLRELAREEGATLFMVALAAFQALLGRYAESDDVVVGSPVAGRTRSEVQGLIGFFANTLVLRTRLDGDPSFRALVRRARETVLGAYEHQDVAFERLVAELQPERSQSHAPLFQVMLLLDEAGAPGGAPAGPAATADSAPAARPLPVRLDSTKFDLTLSLDAHAGGLGGVLEYAADLWDRATAERMAGHLVRILAHAAVAPDLPLSRLEPMGAAERARVVDEWNRTAAAADGEPCIHRRFQAQAARTPDAVAVASAAGDLTYRALEERANRLANHLVRLGVGPEVRVGLCLERGPEMIVALLAVLAAGGAYVPLDPSYPPDRLAFMLADSGIAVLLTKERLRGTLPIHPGIHLVAVDTDASAIAANPSHPPRTAVAGENLAYVLYTSGSTGRPKGVAMHHAAVGSYLSWAARTYPGGSAAVHTPLSFDLTVTSVWVPLLTGGRVELIDEAAPVEALARRLAGGSRFGMLKLTPTHLRILGEQLEGTAPAGGAECLVVGGEALLGADLEFWRRTLPDAVIVNEYGPTETAVGCCIHAQPLRDVGDGQMPIGRPAANTRLYVLDPAMRPAPIGVPGELYIGGAQLARGYLNRPGMTAERFVPDPFSADAGGRLYRTGDRARWRADGTLEYLGRRDAQVKIRGFRIETGEVEAVLRAHPAVAECVVVAREDRPGDRRLVAYAAATTEAEDLRAHLRRALPEHMVPAAIVVMDALPLTPNGKLDRRALPAPEHAAGDELDEPRDFTEARLLQIWEELLGVRGIGPTQSFFALGGNSLLALRLFARVNRAMGCDLPVSTLFAGATVRQMAAAVCAQQRGAEGPRSPVVPLQPGGTLPPLFCVHAADRGVIGYVNLVRHLGAEQPVYGLRDLGEDRGRPVERIAAEYVEAVRTVQPRGPYHLAGWSFGGFVAFEMARRLETEGEIVAFVGLLDAMAPDVAQAWPWSRDADLAAGLAEDVAARARRPFHLDRASLEGLDAEALVRRVVEALHAQDAAPAGFDAEALRGALALMRDRNRSLAGYVMRPVRAPLTLFRAGEVAEPVARYFGEMEAEEARTRGWCRHTPHAVRVHEVPGGHSTLGSEPHVRDLAAVMRDALASAREPAGQEGGVAGGQSE